MTKIIAFEGIDGSGKTVQFIKLTEYLEARKQTVAKLEFPDYTGFFGRSIGGMLSGDNEVSANNVDPKSMALWFAMDRYLTMKDFEYAPFDYVIMNRYVLSNAVYQGIRCDDSAMMADWVFELEHDVLQLPRPDVYLFFDVDEENAGKNVINKGHRDYCGDKKDVYEDSTQVQTGARACYLECSSRFSDIIIIHCTKNGVLRAIDDIASDVIAALQERGIVA